MPNEFFSPEGDLEKYFVTEYWVIDQYSGDQLWGWGSGSSGYLGNNNGFTVYYRTPITTFSGGSDWEQVSAGGFHSAAIKRDGTLWVWGAQNGTGELGTGDYFDRSTPTTTVLGGSDWKQVSCSSYFTAALKTDGTIWTWGDISDGRLGRKFDISTPVTTFSGGTNWADTATTNPEDLYTISAGGEGYSAAIKTDGTLWVWGTQTYGMFGNNLTDPLLYELVTHPTPITTFAGGTNWRTVSAGYDMMSAIKTDGTLWVWGKILGGQLGGGQVTLDAIRTPITTFAGGTNWKQVSCSSPGRAVAAIKTDGTLWVWGQNSYGKLGEAATNLLLIKSTPITTFAGGTNWRQVSIGPKHTAATKTDGTLWVWGNNGEGELGINTLSVSSRLTPVTTFAGGTNWKQVICGASSTAAVKTDGTLWTWGEVLGNGYSLGQGLAGSRLFRNTPVTTFAGGTNWSDTATTNPEDLYTVDGGEFASFAIKTDGTLWTWGYGLSGQLGNAQTIGIVVSTPITTFAGGTNWKQVSSGRRRTLAIKTDGTLWVWGSAAYGGLGNGQVTGAVSTPVTTFAGGTNWKQVSTFLYTTTAIKTDGTLWTWGSAIGGGLGNGVTTFTDVSTPITTFAGGTNWKTCDNNIAIKTDGTLWVWGGSSNGLLGNNQITGVVSTPITTFAGGTNWKQVSKASHVSAVKTDGTLWVWGPASLGALGNGDINSFAYACTPITTFAGGTNWKQTVVLDSDFAIGAVKTDGTLWTWGSNTAGQLGIGILGNIGIGDRSTPVTTFAGGTNWKQIGGGTCFIGLNDDGVNKRIYLFGKNNKEQLGIFYTGNLVPNQIFGGGTNWKQVSLSRGLTAEGGSAVKTDGTLWTWGKSAFGQLGSGSLSFSLTPVTTFTGGTDWKQVFSGRFHHVGLKGTAGSTSIYSFGYDVRGQLGNNISQSIPGIIYNQSSDWEFVTTFFGGCFAIKNNGTLWGWGTATLLGTNIFQGTPVETPVTTFAGGTNWKKISGAPTAYHVAAIKTDGTLWVWGSNISGELGVSSQISIYTPVTTFAGGTNWKQVSVSRDCTAAIKTDGTLWTWGRNINNQRGKIGDNTTVNKLTPVTTFAGGTDWKQVSGSYNSCSATKIDGTLWSWGYAYNGENGNNVVTPVLTPVTTFSGGTDWKYVSSGYYFRFAIKSGVSANVL